MKKLTIEINIEGAALRDYPEYETADILRKLAEQWSDGDFRDRIIMDSNGNTVGSVSVES